MKEIKQSLTKLRIKKRKLAKQSTEDKVFEVGGQPGERGQTRRVNTTKEGKGVISIARDMRGAVSWVLVTTAMQKNLNEALMAQLTYLQSPQRT